MAGLKLSIDPTGMVSGGKTAESALDRVKRKAVGAENALDKTGAHGSKSMAALGGAIKSMSIVASAALGTVTAALSLGKFISATSKVEAVQAQLAAAIRSTGGAAGQSVASLNANAAALQKVTVFGDEATNAMQAVLLTFANIKGDKFARATSAVQDLATAMHMDLKSAALQVGKALNDPILGVTALARAGIQFSDAQKAMIKSMVETNDVAGAQKIILAELEKQFGGSAEAARNTLGGAMTALGNAWGDVFELGNKSSNGLRKSVEGLVETISSPEFVSAIQSIGSAFFGAAEVAANALSVLGDHIGEIGTIGGAFAAFFAGKFVWAMGAAAAGVGGVTMSLTALKAALIRTGIGALIVGVGELAYHLGLFSDAADESASAQTRMNDALGLYSQTRGPDARAEAVASAKATIEDTKAKLANAQATVMQIRADLEARRNIATGGENRPDIPGPGSLEDLKLQTAIYKADELQATLRLAVVHVVNMENADLAGPIDAATTPANGLAGAIANSVTQASSLVEKFGISLQLANTLAGMGLGANAPSLVSDERGSQRSAVVSARQVGTDRAIAAANARVAALTKPSSSGSGASQIDQTKQAYDSLMASLDPAIAASQKFAAGQKTINDALAAGNIELPEWQNSMDALDASIGNSGGLMKNMANAVKSAMGGLFDAIVAGGGSAGKALVNLARQLASMALQASVFGLLAKALPGTFGAGGFMDLTASAKGNVFDGGNVVPFARGGVVSGPTLFPFANGTGLMGEAGPEAIMPLKRGPSGRLGVSGGGGGGTVINIVDQRQKGAAIEQRKDRGPDGREIVTLFVKDEISRGTFAPQLAARHGVGTQKVRR